MPVDLLIAKVAAIVVVVAIATVRRSDPADQPTRFTRMLFFVVLREKERPHRAAADPHRITDADGDGRVVGLRPNLPVGEHEYRACRRASGGSAMVDSIESIVGTPNTS